MKRITKYVVSLIIAIFLVFGVVWNLSKAVTFGSLEEIKSGANVSNSVRLYNMYNVIIYVLKSSLIFMNRIFDNLGQF